MGKKRGGKLETDEKIAIWAMLVFHLTGLLLLSFSRGQVYKIALDFVPINLILTALVVVKFQEEFSLKFWQFTGFSFFTGLIVEIIGVNTGRIFGNYQYGEVLGPGFLNTPVLIGLNWFLVSYCALSASDFLPVPGWAKYLLSVLMLVGLDYLIEPVAMRLGFWNWEGGNIPLQNYIGWAIVSSIILLQPPIFSFKRKNRVAGIAFLIQCLFFLLMGVF
jgi:putative membrane protein